MRCIERSQWKCSEAYQARLEAAVSPTYIKELNWVRPHQTCPILKCRGEIDSFMSFRFSSIVIESVLRAGQNQPLLRWMKETRHAIRSKKMHSCTTLTFIILVFETAIVLLVRFAKALQIREGSGSSRTDVTRKELEPTRLYRRCNRKDFVLCK